MRSPSHHVLSSAASRQWTCAQHHVSHALRPAHIPNIFLMTQVHPQLSLVRVLNVQVKDFFESPKLAMRKANEWDGKSHFFLVFCVCQVNFCRNSLKQIFSHRLIPLLVSLSPSEYICTQKENLIHRTGIIHRKTNSERINQLTENPLTSSTLQCQLFLYIRYLLGRKKR